MSIQQFARSPRFALPRAHASTQAERDIALRDAIERVVLEFPGYGYRRVTAELHRQHWAVNHKRVLRIMRQEALLCQLQRTWTFTTDSRHRLQTYPNLLAGLALQRPNQAWVAEEVYLNQYETFADAEAQIGQFIDDVYNQTRLHSSLGYLPPVEYESLYNITQKHPSEMVR